MKDYSTTSFHQAARDGNCAIIEEKISNEFTGKRKKRISALNELDGNRMSPLHYAAKYGHHLAAKMLVQYGADVFIRGDDGCLPIHLAVKYRPDVFTRSFSSNDGNNDDGVDELQYRISNDIFVIYIFLRVIINNHKVWLILVIT